MEVKLEIQREYNPAHPNFKRWQLARDISADRAKFIESLLTSEISLNGLKILDLGSGEGNTSSLLAKNNFVASLEPKRERIRKIFKTNSLQPVMANGLNFPFKLSSFDLIILQDVIEHIPIDYNFIRNLHSLLNDEGKIYLSTPNKLSLFNIISDPHWGLPLLSLFKRHQIKKYFLGIFRKNDYHRDDIAELFSLKQLVKLVNDYFIIKLYTKNSVRHLMNGGKGIIWSNFHLKLVKAINLIRLKKIIIGIANNKKGLVNKYFTPTFYIILTKK